jgi:hypothetical protein
VSATNGEMGSGPPRKRPVSAREWLLLAVCILLLLAGTLPPLLNLGRYQQRIAGAISRSIGRPVSVDSIRLQLLPWPAFALENLTVGEDPGFGGEPALRAPEVILEPSLLSLWRGRFEISKVEISDASVNLVRNPDGRWNISSVLLQASHVQNAPTGKAHAGQAPRFPYIEATGTRVNIKRGLEKLPYSLLNADFSMWLADPGTWQIRLQGQPARTDMAAASGDTGNIRVNGEIHRATELGGMPVSLSGEWTDAPLGQAGRLVLGRDVGWRGQVDLHAHFTGEMDALTIRAHLEIANLHRQEFTPQEPVGVDAACAAHYSRAEPASDAFHCRWPVGDGALVLNSGAATAETPRRFTLAVEHVSASFPVRVAGLLRGSLPAADDFTGTLNGSLAYDTDTRQLSGTVTMPSLQIANAGADGAALELSQIALSAGDDSPLSVKVTAAPVPLGVNGSPLAVAGELGPHGYTLTANGSLTLSALQAAAAELRLPRLRHLSAEPHGVAVVTVALTTAGPWMTPECGDGSSNHATGTLQLSNVQWQPGWLPVPVQMHTADAILAPESIRWNVPQATLLLGNDTAHALELSGNAEEPLVCASGAECPLEFSISTPALSTDQMQTLFASRRNALLSAVLASFDPTHIHLPLLQGSIRAGVFTLGRLPIRNAVALLATGTGPGGAQTLRIESLGGRTLGGSLHLMGTVSSLSSGPTYNMEATLSGASAAKAGALWHETWGNGTLGGTANVSMSGSSADELSDSARGTFQASWQNGSLGSVLPKFALWSAAGTVSANGLELKRSTLSGTAETLTGTIGWDRTLQLQMTPAPGAPAVAITGTLSRPIEAKPSPTGAAQ